MESESQKCVSMCAHNLRIPVLTQSTQANQLLQNSLYYFTQLFGTMTSLSQISLRSNGQPT